MNQRPFLGGFQPTGSSAPSPKEGIPVVTIDGPQGGQRIPGGALPNADSPSFRTYNTPTGKSSGCIHTLCKIGNVMIRGEFGHTSGKTTSIAITIEDQKNGFFALTSAQLDADPQDFKTLKLMLKMMAEAVRDVR